MTRKTHIFRVIFSNQGKVYEVYARSVDQGGLFGFVEIEGLLFGEKTTLVVDPSEEALQQEFSGVEKTLIPMHSVIRIDQVEKRGPGKIYTLADSSGKVAPITAPIYTPVKKE